MSPDRRPRAASMRSRLALPIGVIAAALMTALTIGVTANVGVAGAAAQTPATGNIEVCKTGNVSNPTAAGFPFSINGGGTFYVAVGHCASAAVPTGQNLVTEELDPTGATTLKSIHVSPQNANVVHKVKNSKSQAGYAKVDVAAGADVTVTFKNQPAIGQLKVCKIAGSPVLDGQFFSFTEQAGGTIVGPFSVQAEPAGTTLDCGGLTSYPVGTLVSIAEAPTPNVVCDSCHRRQLVGRSGRDGHRATRWYDRCHLHQLDDASASESRLPGDLQDGWRFVRGCGTVELHDLRQWHRSHHGVGTGRSVQRGRFPSCR